LQNPFRPGLIVDVDNFFAAGVVLSHSWPFKLIVPEGA